MKVLIAEDSAPTRRMLEVTLQRRGYEVTAAADGQAAWEAFERERPELVILDWQMPILDGLEVCRRIRAAGEETFVLMITSRDDEGDLANALEAGVDDYVMKPVTAEHFRARLRIAERRIALGAARRRAEEALVHARWLAGIGETALAVQHEINNPLAAAIMHLALAAECECTPEVREHVELVSEQVRRIAAVVTRLRTLDEPRSVEYVDGARMLDLSKAAASSDAA